MKARFSLVWVGMLVGQFLAAQVHIQVTNPETWNPESLRPYIGQTVKFDVPMVVTNNYNGLQISTRRLFSPTNQALPGSNAYYSIMNLNNNGSINLTGNIPIAEGDADYRLGQKIYNLTAYVNSTSSLRWISGKFEGNTRNDLENADIRAMVNIDDCDECLLVCTMNLEYYLAENTGSGTMGPSSSSAHQRQRAKTSKALAKINADLYGLVEIEQGQHAAKEIANDLNANLPGRNYTIIDDGGSASGTYTKSAFVYDKNKLKPIGKLQENNTRVQNRKKMICFEEIATGERFIFSVNHFKAKSGSGSGADADQYDGQGSFNASRCEEAQSIMDQYLTYQRNSLIQESDILLMGDLNAYGYEDPIILMINNGMIDLHRAFHADSSYSYSYRGEAGYLDHALCNGSLRPQVKGAAAFHINSDESDNYTYDKSDDQTMFRSSDHDPMLVGLHLDRTLTYDPSPILNSFEVLHNEADYLTISNAFKNGSNSYYAIYDIYGHPIKASNPLSKEVSDAVYSIEENHQKIELPSLPGIYILHVYYDYKVYTYKFIVR